MEICSQWLSLIEYLIGTQVDKSIPDDSASWEEHISNCPSCTCLSRLFKNIQSELMFLAQEEFRLACTDMTVNDLAMYISQNEKTRENATSCKVSRHIQTCPICADIVKMLTLDGDGTSGVESCKNNLIEGLVKSFRREEQSIIQGVSPLPTWLHRAFELFSSEAALVPVLDVALGTGFLRAFQPLHSVVRHHFIFSWASNRHARTFELTIYELDDDEQVVTQKIVQPSDSPLQQISSEKVGYVFRHEHSYCWSVAALDDSGGVIAETNPICFFPKEIILDKKQDAVSIQHRNIPLEGLCDSLSESVLLINYGLYDEAEMILKEKEILDPKFLAACLVSIYEDRLAKCQQGLQNIISPMKQMALSNVQRHLRASLLTWETKLAQLMDT